jgi:LysE type translocator
VLLAHPVALQVLRWGGVAMLCWMAWRMATAGQAGQNTKAPAGFFGMAAFQGVNPKGRLVGVAAIAAFLDRRSGGALAQAAMFATVFMLVALARLLPGPLRMSRLVTPDTRGDGSARADLRAEPGCRCLPFCAAARIFGGAADTARCRDVPGHPSRHGANSDETGLDHYDQGRLRHEQ